MFFSVSIINIVILMYIESIEERLWGQQPAKSQAQSSAVLPHTQQLHDRV